MRRQAGFTLLELMIYIAVFAVFSTAIAGVAHSIHKSDRFSAAYVRDVGGLRRALRLVENDLRHAKSPDELDYELEDGVLSRDGKAIARNIALFDLEADGRLVTVTIALGQRADVPPARRPAITTRVRLRRRAGR